MYVYMLITGSGPLMLLSSHSSIEDRAVLDKLAAKGIDKFLAYQVPYDLAAKRYGQHFNVVATDLHETDDLRVLDYNGERAFRLFRFDELGSVVVHDPAMGRQSAA